jgi:hypothetical protein
MISEKPRTKRTEARHQEVIVKWAVRAAITETIPPLPNGNVDLVRHGVCMGPFLQRHHELLSTFDTTWWLFMYTWQTGLCSTGEF